MPDTTVVPSGDARQEAIVMDPNFIRPVMTNYLANRSRDTPSAEDRALASGVSPSPRRSLTTKARQALGAVLISLGSRLSATPQMAYTEPAGETAGLTS